MFRRYGGLIFGIILFIAVIGVATRLSESGEFVISLSGATPIWIILALLFQAGTYFANAGMWRPTLHRAGALLPFPILLRLSLAKLFTDQTLPTAGLSGSLLVMEAMVQRKIPRTIAIRALFVGLTGYYFAYAFLFLLAVIYIITFATLNTLILWTALIFAIVVLAFAILLLLFWLGDLGKRLPAFLSKRPAFAPFIEAVGQAPGHITRDWPLLLETAGAASLIFIFDAASLWFIAKSLGLVLGPGQAFAAFMVSSVAMTIGLVPGGLGVFEGASTAMLVFFGIPVGSALTATLILRGMTYWLPLLPGVLIVRQELAGDKTRSTETELVG